MQIHRWPRGKGDSGFQPTQVALAQDNRLVEFPVLILMPSSFRTDLPSRLGVSVHKEGTYNKWRLSLH